VSMWHDLSVIEKNDVVFNLSLTLNGALFDYTNYTLTLVLKETQTSDDSAGTAFTVGSGLTVVSMPLGKVNWALPHTSTGTPGKEWWHIYAVDGSANRTDLMLGNLTVMAA
jgi:hypothetical protein